LKRIVDKRKSFIRIDNANEVKPQSNEVGRMGDLFGRNRGNEPFAKRFNALVGQAMKATKGKANPAQVTALLKQKLG
jgi:hypothetical protein